MQMHELVTNYVKLEKDLYLPFYIYNKLTLFNSDMNNMHKLVQFYNTRMFYSTIKTKIFKFIISLFDVECELWSNPFICIRPFCSNGEIDKIYGGIEPLDDNFDPKTIKSMILVDQRPNIELLPSHIDHSNSDNIFVHKMISSLKIISRNRTSNLTLLIVSLNIIHLPKLNIDPSIKIHSFNVANMYIYFVQTQSGYKHISPSNTKIDILASFIKNKEANFQTHSNKINHIILGASKRR